MRLPFLAGSITAPVGSVQNARALAFQGQFATAVTSAAVVQAVALQGQTATARVSSSATALQGQFATGIVRSFAQALQGQFATATPSTVSGVYANGYLYQFEARLQAWASGAPTVANFLLPFNEVNLEFRTVANGGKVSSSAGNDIRFETTGGTKLGHKLLAYDGATGRVVALVNMPRNFAADQSFYVYVGKTGASAEEDATAARAGGWLAWYCGNSGTDLTGQSRTLTPNSAPPSAVIGNWPAADADGTADYFNSSSAATWLSGLSALTAISYHEADVTSLKHEVFNVATGTPGVGAATAGELSLHFNETTDNRLTAICKFGASTLQYQCANNRQTTDPQAVGFCFQSGQPTRMVIDGVLDVPSSRGANPAGTTNITDTLEWGRGFRGDLAYWDGKLSFLGFCSTAQSTAALESMTAAFAEPRKVYGLGSSNRVTDTNLSPVALRVNATTAIGNAIGVDVGGAGYDPESDASVAISASVVSGSGTVTTNNTRNIVITPSGAVAQKIVVQFTLRDRATGGKTSVGRCYLNVAEADLFLNPFVADAAHHRPIGKDYEIGIPPALNLSGGMDPGVPYDTPANRAIVDAAMARMTKLVFSAGRETYKYLHRVAPTDPVRKVGWRGLRRGAVGKSGSGLGFEPNPGVTLKDIRMPTPGTVRDGFTIEYPPDEETADGSTGDNTVLFYPQDGDPTSTIAVTTNQFRYNGPPYSPPNPGGYTQPAAQQSESRFLKYYGFAGMDYKVPGDTGDVGTGAAVLRIPSCYLREFELVGGGGSDPDPGPINHCLNLVGCRKGPAATQWIGRARCWPSQSVDGGIEDDPTINRGPWPYGTRFFIPPTPANKALRNDPAVCANNVEKRIFDCLMYYGGYLCDGHGEPGELRIRIDNTIPTSVQNALENGILKRIVARKLLLPLYNPRPLNTETERFTTTPPGGFGHGLCFAGKGGPVDDNSVNNAYNAGPTGSP